MSSGRMDSEVKQESVSPSPAPGRRRTEASKRRLMAELVADFILKRLREWGVHRIYGYPGDGINGFLGALDRADGDPEFIQARHEEMAAFMACGHAKFTDEVGVCTLIVPNDVQEEKAVESPPREHGAVYSSVGYTRPRVLPHEQDLERAAQVLNEGKKVAMLVGQGAAGARNEVIETAELLGAGVAKALLGKDVLADDLPFVTGPIGLLGSTASYELIEGCDTLLMVGTSFPYAEFLPKEGQARCVEIDLEASRIGIRYPVDAPLVGDAKETLKALLPKLRRKER